jgi:hypothetical protein
LDCNLLYTYQESGDTIGKYLLTVAARMAEMERMLQIRLKISTGAPNRPLNHSKSPANARALCFLSDMIIRKPANQRRRLEGEAVPISSTLL